MIKQIQKSIVLLALSLVSSMAGAQDLIINEVVSDNRTGLVDSNDNCQDWIEIYNNTSKLIYLSGYYLTDDTENTAKWQFPNVSIPSNSYRLIFASEKNGSSSELHANFKIADGGETISLYNASGSLIDQLEVPKLKKDISYGHEDGTGKLKFFAVPTPNKKNKSEAYIGYLPAPDLSQPSGFYTENIDISATHEGASVSLRYTLDGSVPTNDSPLLPTSLSLSDVSSKSNVFSMIPTNPSFDYCEKDYTESRAQSRGWLPPYILCKKTNVIQVAAFKDGYISSKSANATYFIFPDGADTYSLPVLSLTTDSVNFFSDETGIYVYGTTIEEGNYKASGREWERSVFLQYFDNEGQLGFEQQLGARIHGGGGRHSTVKNLRMYARDEYGKDKIKYSFFNDKNNDEFERLLIRGPGHRPDCFPRDDMADLLLENQDMDIQHIHPSILFINGEYWGIHTIKERFDARYLSGKYGKDKDDYVIMKNAKSLDVGEDGDDDHYLALLDYVDKKDMTLESDYNYVNTQMDIENYTNYMALEIFMGNSDWITNNIRYYRYKGEDGYDGQDNALDGRWRWLLFDFDLVFGGSGDRISYSGNVLDDALDPEKEEATILMRGLMKNSKFKNDFINRMCDLMNTTFSKQNFNRCVTQIDETMTPEMLEHTNRWRYPSIALNLEDRRNEAPSLERWSTIIEDLYEYMDDRPRKIINYFKKDLELEDTCLVTLNVNDRNMGTVKLNSILINEELDGASTTVYPWAGIYYKNIPVTIEAIPAQGYRFVKWEEQTIANERLTLELDKNTQLTAIFELDPTPIAKDVLYINEIMASNNKTVNDEFDANADWVEIYNPNDKAIDLTGYFISDDVDNRFKYQIPTVEDQNTIEANGYKLIWCDGKDDRGSLHTTLKLNASGEAFILSRPDSSIVDSVSFCGQEEDISYGRLNDGEDNWHFFTAITGATPGSENIDTPSSFDKSKVDTKIELYPNPVVNGELVYFGRTTDFYLFNSLGQCLHIEKDASSLKTKDLSPGVYFLRTDSEHPSKLIVK